MRAPLVLALLLGAIAPAAAWEAPCPPCEEPRGDGIPFQWDLDASGPPRVAPLPQGFSLTVPVAPSRDAAASAPASLARYVEVGPALARCWSSTLTGEDARWRDLTVRLSFKRDGAVNGVPRVVHVSDAVDAAAASRGRQSLLFALQRCTPLALSPTLGQAIAGQIFAIRFTQQRTS